MSRRDVRKAVTDPWARVAMGVPVAIIAVAADAWKHGFHPVRFASGVVLTVLGFWLLTPLAELSDRSPFRAGVLAALFGAGSGAVWWAAFSPGFTIWIAISIGSGLAVFSLAPFDEPRQRGRAGPPPRRPAVAARRWRFRFTGARARADESNESRRHSAESLPSV